MWKSPAATCGSSRLKKASGLISCRVKSRDRSVAVPATSQTPEVSPPAVINAQTPVPKKEKLFFSIHVYANGGGLVPPVHIRIPPFKMKRLEDVTTIVAKKMGFRAGVKGLYMPDGHPIQDPKELISGGHYVAVGMGQFKAAPYGQKDQMPSNDSKKECKESSPAVPTSQGQEVIEHVQTPVPKKEKLFFSIHVYANGEGLVPPVHIRIPLFKMKRLDDVTAIVAKKMGFRAGVKGLYTLDGHPIKDPKELINGGHCVAVGTGKFKPAPYGQQDRYKECFDSSYIPSSRSQSQEVIESVQTPVRRKEKLFFSIHVYANGEGLVPPTHIKIPVFNMKRLDDVTAIVARKMGFRAGVKGLYTLDGHPIKDPKKLIDGGHYVAVGTGQFKPAPYGQKAQPPGKNTKNQCDESSTSQTVIMESFLAFLEAPEFEPMIGEKIVDDRLFAEIILDILRSESPDMRDILKRTLTRIFEHLERRRLLIFELIKYILITAEDDDRRSGLPDLLETLGSLIQKFGPPACKPTRTSLLDNLLLLQISPELAAYHQQFFDCIMQFLKKDKTIVVQVVTWLLDDWPHGNVQNELIFLDKLEVIYHAIHPSEYHKVQQVIFQVLHDCVRTKHDEVVDRIMKFCSENIIHITGENPKDTLKSLLKSMHHRPVHHWDTLKE